MIPDTYCTKLGPENGYICPDGMKCMELKNIKREDRGFNGFDEIGELFAIGVSQFFFSCFYF
jgi:hypothetical protein